MIYAMADWSLMLGGVGLNKPHILTWENRKYQLKKGEEATSICECCGGKMAVGTSSRIILLQIDEMVALHQVSERSERAFWKTSIRDDEVRENGYRHNGYIHY